MSQEKIAIKIIALDSKTNQRIPQTNIEVYSRNFIELKGITKGDGIYSSFENPSSKYLAEGENIFIRCYKEGYEPKEKEFRIGRTTSDRVYTIRLDKSSDRKVYFRGIAVDADNESILKNVIFKLSLKGEQSVVFESDEYGFNKEIEKDKLIDPERLEIIITKDNYQPKTLDLSIPASGNIPPQKIYLKKKAINSNDGNTIHKNEGGVIGYIPFAGHFARNDKEYFKGYILSGLFISSLVTYVYSTNKEDNLIEEARSTQNQISKQQLIKDADLYLDIRQYSLISMGLITLTSLAINILDQKKYLESELGMKPFLNFETGSFVLGTKVLLSN